MAIIMADHENRSFTDKFMLRLPDGMRDRIKSAADLNGRSMNAEIIATLDEKYPNPFKKHHLDEAAAWVAKLNAAETDEEFNSVLSEANDWQKYLGVSPILGFSVHRDDEGRRLVMLIVDRARPRK